MRLLILKEGVEACYTILRLCLYYWIIRSGSIARAWNTHFIIFSFRTRDSFPEGIF